MAVIRFRAGDFEVEIPASDGFHLEEVEAAFETVVPQVVEMYRAEKEGRKADSEADAERAKTRERVAAHRQRKKQCNADVTECNVASVTNELSTDLSTVTVTKCNGRVTECNVTQSPYNPLNNNNNNSLDNKHTLRVTANEDSYGNPLPEQDWETIHKSYFTEFGVLMPQGVREDDVYQAYKALGKNIVVLAIQHTARNAGDSVGRHAYLMAVLRAWISSGVKTVAEANAQIERHQRETRQKNGADDRMRIKTNEDYYVPGAPDGFGWGDLLDVKT